MNTENFINKYNRSRVSLLQAMLLQTLSRLSSFYEFKLLVQNFFVPEEMYNYKYIENFNEEKIIFLLNHKEENYLMITSSLPTDHYTEDRKVNLQYLQVDGEYKSLATTLHELIERAIYNANPKLLITLVQCLSRYQCGYTFDVDASICQKNLVDWLRENISLAAEGKNVGWRSGPCNAVWPSTHPQDYQDCLEILKAQNWIR